MNRYYLMKKMVTGKTYWEYISFEDMASSQDTAQLYYQCAEIPAFIDPSVEDTIYSKKVGPIKTSYDPDKPIFEGIKRYGKIKNEIAFSLEWQRDYYILHIPQYDDVIINDKESSITFTINDTEIAKLIKIDNIEFEKQYKYDEYDIIDSIQILEIDSRYLDILEIIASYSELKYAPIIFNFNRYIQNI